MVEKPIHDEFECIVDENYQLEKLINMDDLRKILEDFYQISPFPTAVLNLKGEVLLESHWESICTRFHRVNPRTAAICTESDTHFNTELVKGDEKHILYRCGNGLHDAASPILIEGQHLGNFFIGQFLLEPPDEGFFRRQAQRYGFQENEYLKDLSRVPIISEHDLKIRLDYLCGFAEFLGNIGLKGVQRDRADVALRESEERYKSLTNNLNVGVYRNSVGSKGKFIEANPAIVNMFGYDSKEEFFKIGVSDLYKDPLERKEFTFKTAKAGSIKNEILELQKKDGTGFIGSVSAVAVKNKKGDIKYFDGIIEDITERKWAEEALLESEEKFRLLSEQSLLAIGIIQDGNIKYANEMYCRITGYSLDEIYEWNPYDYAKTIYEEDLPFVMEQSKKKQAGDKDVATNYQFRGFTKAKNIVWWDLYSETIVYHGKPADLFTLVDITERIKSEKDKRKLEKQLQNSQKMEAIGTLAGGIAHDFNNLLMAIQGRTSIMLMDKDSSHPDFGHLRGIEGCVGSAADLTRQLLGIARGGKYEVKPTDLNELIQKENRMFGRTKKEITIREKYEDNLWSVEVDRGQIQQVLLNLYVNAWQAMPFGGELHIRTQNVTLDENFLKPYQVEPGRYVQISITDTGIGMDKATEEKIFDPFFTTKEMGRGTGLGLASAYGIIKNHGGFINVYSETGHGSTFNVYLPASENEVVEEKKPPVDLLMGSETVLFVDDEDMIIEVAEALLERLGYKVLIAGTGKEAIKIYEENKEQIDIVVLDMIMPDMSGGETYDRMKEINPRVKVLLSSGYSINGQATEILDRGCNGFIQKPFKIKELSQKLREVLDDK